MLLAQARSQLATSGDCRMAVQCAEATRHRFNLLRTLSVNAIRANAGANVCCSHKPDHSLTCGDCRVAVHKCADLTRHRFNLLCALSFNAICGGECLLLAQARSQLATSGDCRTAVQCAEATRHRFDCLRTLSVNAIRANTGQMFAARTSPITACHIWRLSHGSSMRRGNASLV